MSENKKMTPAVIDQVSFKDEIDTVKGSLKTRTEANEKVQKAWGELKTCLIKYKVNVPYRRPTLEGLPLLIRTIVYVEKPKPSELLEGADSYLLQYAQSLRTNPLIRKLDTKFKGLLNFIEDADREYRTISASPKIDEKATAKAQQELRKLADKYADAVLEFEKTINTLSDVKEFIGVVKNIAEISGAQSKANKEKK